MVVGALIPLVVFVLIIGSVGIRLVGLWRRTRELPELSLGGGLVLISLAMPFAALGRVPGLGLETPGRLAFAVGMIAVGIGLSGVIFFNHRVFRRGSGSSLAFFALLCVLVMGSVGCMAWWNFLGESIEAIKATMRPAVMTLLGATTLSFAWGAAESFGYHRAVARQLALGLGDPVVANRFLLWAAANATSAFLVLVIAGCVAYGMTIMQEPVPLVVLGICGMILSASWALTFFAPKRYLDFVRERDARSA